MSYTDHFSPARAAAIHVEVLRLLQVEHLYRDVKLNARTLAKKVGCDVRAISAAIALSTDGNCPQLIAKVRCQEAVRLLSDPKNDHLNCEEVGLLCGFSNRQSFYNAFRKHIGTTPIQYRNHPTPHIE